MIQNVGITAGGCDFRPVPSARGDTILFTLIDGQVGSLIMKFKPPFMPQCASEFCVRVVCNSARWRPVNCLIDLYALHTKDGSSARLLPAHTPSLLLFLPSSFAILPWHSQSQNFLKVSRNGFYGIWLDAMIAYKEWTWNNICLWYFTNQFCGSETEVRWNQHYSW